MIGLIIGGCPLFRHHNIIIIIIRTNIIFVLYNQNLKKNKKMINLMNMIIIK